MRRATRPRRGVLLLIVLSLLVLFLLVGMSFLVSATAFRDMAAHSARPPATNIDGTHIANSSINQILHGNKSPLSQLRGHSLLEDLYGRDYFVGRVKSGPSTTSGNQLQTIRFDFVRWGSLPPAQLRDHYYGGSILTYITGEAAGQSTRILSYRSGLRRIKCLGVLEADPIGQARRRIRTGDLFVVNGRPLNGTGAGFSQLAATAIGSVGGLNNSVSLAGYQIPAALLPNYAGYRFRFLIGNAGDPATMKFEELAVGGLDESYDAVDYQNMALAKVPVNVNAASRADAGNTFLANTSGIIPSFHRPYLLSYMAKNYPDVLRDPRGLRALLFRPNQLDHPSFTGSNPTFNRDRQHWNGQPGADGVADGLFAGPWDVDNDADGIPDSIWMDFGHAPVTGADGRMYKPLVAPLVIDLDGRINLNTAGSTIQSRYRNSRPQSWLPTAGRFAGATISSEVVGGGFGPADVNPFRLLPVYRDGTALALLRQRYRGAHESDDQYEPGEYSWGSVDEDLTRWRQYGIGGNIVPDQFREPDQVSEQALAGKQTSLDTGWGSCPDLSGALLPFITPNGGMAYGGRFLDSSRWTAIGDPYEFDPLQHRWQDNPYSIADLDFLLRFEDSRTFSRLQERSNDRSPESPFDIYRPNGEDGLRRFFTTRSVHIPALPSVNPGLWRHDSLTITDGQMMRGEGLRRSVWEMFLGRISRRLPSDEVPDAQKLASKLLPPQLARGERLDINQALMGNDDQKRRFATHLYNLMMLLTDAEIEMPSSASSGLTPAERRELHVRRIAQWAINVVDFGDADSAMTYFEYDVDPFNIGPDSQVDGDPFGTPEPDARRIWGCEHPELILSETLATHDRRVEDTDLGGPREENGSLQDPDLDQAQNPQASAFIELLCMRGMAPAGNSRRVYMASERGPEDLYVTSSLTPSAGQYWPRLNLGKTDVYGNPVWQLAISERHTDTQVDPLQLQASNPEDTSFEPSDFSLLHGRSPQLKIERRVWFHRPNGIAPPDVYYSQGRLGQDYSYQSNKRGAIEQGPQPVVEPGMYVVVGPRAISNIGLRKSGEPSGQNVVLVDQQQVDQNLAHRDLSGDRQREFPPQRAVSIVVANSVNGRRTGLNVSAPLGGYSDTPTDQPKDSPLNPQNAESAPLWYNTQGVEPTKNLQLVTGLRESFRTVFLQRLANAARPWNANPRDSDYNPYITVDWMPIDLTVFNSLADDSLEWDQNLGEFDPQNPEVLPEDALLPEGLVPFELAPEVGDRRARGLPGYFASRERSGMTFGGQSDNPIVGEELNIWAARSQLGRAFGLTAEQRQFYHRSVMNLHHTLGWLNRTFDVTPHSTPLHDRDGMEHYIVGRYSEAPNSYEGKGKRRTFPTLVWNNRPYANEYELMLVPACAPSRLSQEFTTSRTKVDLRGRESEQAQPVNVPIDRTKSREMSNVYRGAFGHLLNFFNSTHGTKNGTPRDNQLSASHHFRIFDFVTVPSRFAGTQTWFETPSASPNSDLPRQMTKFREPGRINLNTAYADEVWSAMLNAPSSERASYREFEQAMAGAGLVPDSPSYRTTGAGDSAKSFRVPDGTFPAEYPFPYRAGVSADLLPPLVHDGAAMSGRLAVDGTLLRTSAESGVSLPLGEPALAKFAVAAQQVRFRFGEFYQSRKSNAYFRYRDVIKLGASATSQSNIYAAWLTVGYFEIEPNYRLTGVDEEGQPAYDYSRPYWVDEAHPDGYRFGAEMGSEIGNVQRHRWFYIMDRSIPVAFEPGVNHNTDKAILLRRRLD